MTNFSDNADDDHRLLQRFAAAGADGQRAFQLLVTRYSGLVYGTAMRLCARPDLATDATQNAFLALGVKAGDLLARGIPSVGAWLHRATVLESKRLMRDVLRAERRHTMIRETISRVPASHAAESSEWEALQPQLDEAIEKLGSPDRDILLLHFFEGLKFDQIGPRLKMKPDAAQKRSVRALGKLSRMLQRHPGATTVALLVAGLPSELPQAAPTALTTKITTAMTAIQSGAATIPSGTLTLIAMTNISKFTFSSIAALLLLLAVSTGTGYMIGDKTRPTPVTRMALSPKPPGRSISNPQTAPKPVTKESLSPAQQFLAEMTDLVQAKTTAMKRAEDKGRRGEEFREELLAVEEVMARADAASGKLSGDNFASAMDLITKLSDWELREMASRTLFFAWIQEDPAKAFQAANSEEHAINSLFFSWGRLDPPTALREMEKLCVSDQSKRRSLLKETLEGWLMADPGQAVAAVESMEFDDQKTAMDRMEVAVFNESKRPLYLQAIAKVADERLRLEMVGEVGKRLAQILPSQATAWFDSLMIENQAIKEETAHKFFRGLQKRDAAKAADWFWGKISPETQGNFLSTFVETEWAAKDKAAADAWLAKHGIRELSTPK